MTEPWRGRTRQYEVTPEQWAAAPFVVRSVWAGDEVDAIATNTAEDALEIARLELDQAYDVHIEQRLPPPAGNAP